MKSRSWLAAILALTAAGARAQVFLTHSFSVDQAIPDPGSLPQTYTWNQPGATINSVQVGLQIDGVPSGQGFNGDLYATLGHNLNDGFAVLLNRPGKDEFPHLAGYDDSGMNIVFDDLAGNGDVHVYRDTLNGNTTRLSGPLTGTWAPDGRNQDPDLVTASDGRTALLSIFQGKPLDGEWRLYVSDLAGYNAQSLTAWSLKVNASVQSGQSLLLNGEVLEPTAPGQNFSNPITVNQNSAIQNSDSFQLSGQITGPGGLTKTGAGELILSGNNSYSGPTVVEQGRLTVQNTLGSGTGTGPVEVTGLGILGGSGFISGTVTIQSGGTVAPGNSPGTLTLGNSTWGPGGSYLWSIGQASGSAGGNPGWSLLNIAGNLSITATSAEKFRIAFQSLKLDGSAGPIHDFDPHQNYSWTIAAISGTVSGFDPSSFTLDSSGFLNDTLDGSAFRLSASGNQLALEYTPVPEPRAYASAFALGLAVFAMIKRILRGKRL